VDRSQPTGIFIDRPDTVDVAESSPTAGCDGRKGRIAEGYDADFVVFDAEAEFAVTEDRLYYRHPVSPYLGERLRGVVQATYLRGRPAFRNGQFAGKAQEAKYANREIMSRNRPDLSFQLSLIGGCR